MHDVIRQCLFLGFGLATLLAIAQFFLPQRTSRNKIFAALYACLAVLELTGWNSDSQFQYLFPHLSMVEVPFTFLIGPLIYVLISESFIPDRKKRYWPHFVAPVVALILLIPYYAQGSVLKMNRIYDIFIRGATHFEEVLYGISIVLNTAYFSFMIRKMAFLWKDPLVRKESAARLMVFIVSISIVIGLVAIACMVSRSLLLLKVSALLIFIGLCVNFIFLIRYPEMNREISLLVREEHYRSSHLKGIDTEELKARLIQAMEQEKIFLDENLSLAKLAAHLQVSMHQLSEFLNTVMQAGFARFINGYRVAEAKRLLSSEPDMNILQIAYASGFNSNSSFHRAFTQLAGVAPKEFRRSQAG